MSASEEKEAAPAPEIAAEAEMESEGVTTKRVRRSTKECKALVKGIDDETVGSLLAILAQEALDRGINPLPPVSSVVTAAGGTGVKAGINDLWGRVVTRVDRSKKGGYRFEGTPVYGRSIMGRDLSDVGMDENGIGAPVVFGRKDMRGTIWLAVAEKAASFDMEGVLVSGMTLVCKSASFDEFEKLCDAAEGLLAGVSAKKVEDRRTVDQKLAAIDDWE